MSRETTVNGVVAHGALSKSAAKSFVGAYPDSGVGRPGCALFLPPGSRYLCSATNQATEADVRHHLGEPARVTADENGKTRWTYETRTSIQEGTNNAWTLIPAWRCDTYVLTFDDRRILHDWSHSSRRC